MSEESILSRLGCGNVFNIERDGDMFIVTEGCDGWFAERLTRDELRQLATEIAAITENDQGETP